MADVIFRNKQDLFSSGYRQQIKTIETNTNGELVFVHESGPDDTSSGSVQMVFGEQDPGEDQLFAEAGFSDSSREATIRRYARSEFAS